MNTGIKRPARDALFCVTETIWPCHHQLATQCFELQRQHKTQLKTQHKTQHEEDRDNELSFLIYSNR